MAGRAMIVGRSRSHIVGAVPHHGYGGDYAELMEFTGAYGTPSIVGAEAPPPPEHHPDYPHHPHHAHPHAYHPHAPPPHASAPVPRGVPVAYVRSAEGPAVIEQHPKDPREFPIGFNSITPVPANSTVGIEQKPQVLFRGERLAVPNSIVLNFDVNDIKVGKDSQLASPGNMPSECFSNLSVGVRMQLDTAEPGITLTLSMFNNDPNNPHVFKSVLYGTVIE